MTKLYFLMLVQLFIVPNLFAQKVEFFESDWERLLEEAKEKEVPIYVALTTPYCESCKEMDQLVFHNKEVADFYNEHFINYKLDVHSELGELLSSQNNVRSFPAHLFFNSDGEIVHQVKGVMPTKIFIEKGQQALDPKKQLYTLKKKIYDDASITFEESLNFCLASYDLGIKDDLADEKFFSLLNRSHLENKDVITVVSHTLYNSNVNSEAFNFFSDNIDFFKENLSRQKLGKIYTGLAKSTLSSSIKGKSIKEFERNMKKLKTVLPENIASRVAFVYEPRFFLSLGNEEDAFKAIQRNFIHIKTNPSASELSYCNDWAWYFYQNSNNTDYLKEALNWINFTVSQKKSYNYLDTQAHLYFKLGQFSESEKVAIEVQDHYLQTGKDTTAISQLIKSCTEKQF